MKTGVCYHGGDGGDGFLLICSPKESTHFQPTTARGSRCGQSHEKLLQNHVVLLPGATQQPSVKSNLHIFQKRNLRPRDLLKTKGGLVAAWKQAFKDV